MTTFTDWTAYDCGPLKTGDVLTFSGNYEPESPWGWLLRRFGIRTTARQLRRYTVTHVVPDMVFYEDEG